MIDYIYFNNLVNLDIAEGQLIKETEAFATYIDERVLWIASASAVSAADVTHAGHVLWKIAGPDAWKEIGCALAIDACKIRPFTCWQSAFSDLYCIAGGGCETKSRRSATWPRRQTATA